MRPFSCSLVAIFFWISKSPGMIGGFLEKSGFWESRRVPRGVAKKWVPSSSFPIHAPSLCGSLRTDALGNVRRATEYNRRGHPQALPGPAARTSLNQGEGRVPCPAVTAIWGGVQSMAMLGDNGPKMALALPSSNFLYFFQFF